MKKMKKLLSLVLAMMLVLAMGSSVMAAPEDTPTAPETKTATAEGYLGTEGQGSLTINNGISGQTYTIYKMFDLVKVDDTYYYTVTDDWKDFVAGAGSAYVKVNTDGYVTWANTATASNTPTTEAFAKAALDYATGKGLTGQQITTTGEATDAAVWTLKFDKLPLGYYLLDSSMGTLCSLDTAEPNATITEKNKKPTIDKDVEEPTASVGDTLNYVVKINVTAGAQNYVLHDQMTTGLDFVSNSIAVKVLSPETVAGIDTSDLNAVKNAEGTPLAEGTDYTVAEKVTHEIEGSDPVTDTFDVTFLESSYANLADGSMIVVTYQAKINENAVTIDQVNNKAYLDYGDKNHTSKTEEPDAPTDLYDLEITKVDGATKAPLTGAEFSLKAEDGTVIKFIQKTEEGKTYYVATTDEEATDPTTIVVESEDGKVLIKGLAAGKYALKEETAPTGYNKLQNDIEVEIKEKESVASGSDVTKVSLTQVTVENNTGAELPSTGGIGTTIFYVLGGILVIGAGIMLVVRKRMGSEK